MIKTLSDRHRVWKMAGLLFCAMPVLLTGCGKSADQSAKKDAVVVWHWMSDRQNAFDELAARYEKEQGVKVIFELYAPSEAYGQKVRAAAQSNTLPEVYGILSETRDLASFIKSGHVENMTPAMESDTARWKKQFYPDALLTNTFPERNGYDVPAGIYGVPIDRMTIQMLYNKNLLKKAGLNPDSPPKTWKEFVQASQKLNMAGIVPFVSGWGELWMIECLMSGYAMHLMGEAKYFDTLKGKVKYTDPDWNKVIALFEEMRREKILMPGAVSMVNKTAEQNFANERAAFALNGSWCVNVYAGMNPKLEYGVMAPPSVNPNRPMKIWGGAGSSFMVNARSRNKDKAVRFLQWLTETEQQVFLSEKTNNLPANRNAAARLSRVLEGFSSSKSEITHPSRWPLREKPTVSEALGKGIQSVLIGEKSPAQLLSEIQKLKESAN